MRLCSGFIVWHPPLSILTCVSYSVQETYILTREAFELCNILTH